MTFDTPPKPSIPTDDTTCWKPEPFDDLYPKDGWINDLIFTARGVATPTFGAFWSGVFVISALLRRDSYLDWGPFKLYPNFYIILVAPPKTCGKSTVVNMGTEKILSKIGQWYDDPKERVLRTPRIYSKFTPESAAEIMKPGEEVYEVTMADPTSPGKLRKIQQTIPRYSEALISSSELTTFLGKQQYNTGLIDRLNDLYDCNDYLPAEFTLKRGAVNMEKVFFGFIAGTTPHHLKYSIPEDAMGGGFLSRITIVNLRPTRAYSSPFVVPFAPTFEDLQKTIAWIGHHKIGKYTLSNEAADAYDIWYSKYYRDLVTEMSEKRQHFLERFDVQLLKLCVILTAQQYSMTRTISLSTFNLALRIMEYTIAKGYGALEDVGETEYKSTLSKVERMIMDKKQMTRRTILQKLSPSGVKVEAVNEVLNHLHQQGKIKIWLNNEDRFEISKHGQELYLWDV